MALFGRRAAHRRQEETGPHPPSIPGFSAPVADCAPWVIGDLWPAELMTVTAETVRLADYLHADLRRIADRANDKLAAIGRSSLTGSARESAEVRVINAARAFAVLRVQSTVRQLRPGTAQWWANPAPADRAEEPAVAEPEPELEPEPEAEDSEPAPPEPAPPEPAPPEPESDEQRVVRLLAFVARQEPRLCWAVGVGQDHHTVLATDLAHGWIPPGIDLPDGVRLPTPARRSGPARALLATVAPSVDYAPGDRLARLADFTGTETSTQPRELPSVEDPDQLLLAATRLRDGLPRMVHTVAGAVAAGTGVADSELDLLRVHLDTARYQLLAQYPDIDAALLLNCMLLAATVAVATADTVSANYHLAWFRALTTPADHRE